MQMDCILVYSKMEIEMEKVSFNGTMVKYLKEIGSIIKKVEKVYGSHQMVRNTKDNGSTTDNMGMVLTNLKIAFIKEAL